MMEVGVVPESVNRPTVSGGEQKVFKNYIVLQKSQIQQPQQPTQQQTIDVKKKTKSNQTICTFSSSTCDGPAVVHCNTCKQGVYQSGYLCNFHHHHRHLKGLNNLRGRMLHQWEELESVNKNNDLVQDMDNEISQKKKKIEEDSRELEQQKKAIQEQQQHLQQQLNFKERSFDEALEALKRDRREWVDQHLTMTFKEQDIKNAEHRLGKWKSELDAREQKLMEEKMAWYQEQIEAEEKIAENSRKLTELQKLIILEQKEVETMTRKKVELEEAIKVLQDSERDLEEKIALAEKKLQDLVNEQQVHQQSSEIRTKEKQKLEEEILELQKQKSDAILKQTKAQQVVTKELERKKEENDEKLKEARKEIESQKIQLVQVGEQLEVTKQEMALAEEKVHQTTLELHKTKQQMKQATASLEGAVETLKKTETELAQIKSQLKVTEEELEEARELKEMKKTLKIVWNMTYNKKWGSEKWKEAEEKIYETRNKYPKNERLIDAQAMCRIHLNDKEGARKLLEDHKQNNPYVMKRLGRVYQSNGEYIKAVECFTEANKLYQEKYGFIDGRCRFAYRCMGDAYVECQQFPAAYICYSRAGSNNKKAYLHLKIAQQEEKKYLQSPQQYLQNKKPLFPVFGKTH